MVALCSLTFERVLLLYFVTVTIVGGGEGPRFTGTETISCKVMTDLGGDGGRGAVDMIDSTSEGSSTVMTASGGGSVSFLTISLD